MKKKKLHVVNFSGGKDSTAMLLRMIEEGWPIDIILFCDTGLEFPELLEHIQKVEEYIGREITVIKAKKNFMWWATEHQVISKENGKPYHYGWPNRLIRYCTRELKVYVIRDYFKELKRDYELVQYCGIAADEPERVKELNYPLVEWGMTERDCLQYCKERGFDWGGSV